VIDSWGNVYVATDSQDWWDRSKLASAQVVVEVVPELIDTFTQRVLRLLQSVRYKPWLTRGDGYPLYRLRVGLDPKGDRVFMQVQCWRPDTNDGHYAWGGGGKSYLSQHMTDSEIVQGAFGLFKAYEEHEAREGFTYMGRRIYGPHMDIEMLWTVADHLDVRT
jgi:hypothetical protein